MTRVLIMIAAVGLALAVFCFAMAGAVGGLSWSDRGLSWRMGNHIGSKWVHIDMDDDRGPRITRDYAWTGGDRLEIDAPADVEYTQGPVTKLTVTGSKGLLDHLMVKDGRIYLDGIEFNSGPLKVVMTAPNITDFAVHGSGDLSIADYKQDPLKVRISGSGNVVARGVAKQVDLEISGSGDGDLGGVAADEAVVRVSGSGDAKLSPKTSADVHVSGSGDVTMLTRPATLKSDVSGSGSVEQPEKSGEKT